MKKKRLLSLIISAVMMLSISGMSASAIGNKDIATTSNYSSVELKRVKEAPTVPRAFNWNNIEKGKTYNLDSKAIRLDLKKTSMANKSLVGGMVEKTDEGYEFTIRGTSIIHEFLGKKYTGTPEEISIFYYVNGEKETIKLDYDNGIKTGESYIDPESGKTLQNFEFTFTIPTKAFGLEPYGAAKSYSNMFKVSMITSLSKDNIIGKLVPGMVTPTFFYAFNVINNGN